jgi:hypothetical protein
MTQKMLKHFTTNKFWITSTIGLKATIHLINFKYWGGANSSAPILVYLGAESSIDGYPNGIGFLSENAATFKALLVYIEVLKKLLF